MVENKLDKLNGGRLFWGLLLIVVGGLALASNFGLIEVNFLNIFRVWPLLIIMAGLSILSFKGLLWKIAITVFSIMSIVFIGWVLTNNISNIGYLNTYTANVKKSSDSINQLDLSVKSGVGTLNLYSAEQTEFVKAKLESNIAKISQNNRSENNTQYISLNQKSNENSYDWMRGDTRNIWNISIGQNLSTNLSVDAGVSSVNIDVTDAKIRRLSIKAGVSNLKVILGENEPAIDVIVDSGVSSLVFRLPKSSGINLILENGLTSNNLSDLKKVSENTYESGNYKESKNKINIKSQVGLSSFTIERY